MSASATNTPTIERKTGYVPQIEPNSSTIEEMDDWIIALGGRSVSHEEMSDIVRSIQWGDVPGENPGDQEFPFAAYM